MNKNRKRISGAKEEAEKFPDILFRQPYYNRSRGYFWLDIKYKK